nr:MAG TPA: Activation induced deaminase [Caudoviricetes sp.]
MWVVHGPCFRCFRTIIKSDEDIDKIGFDESLEIGTYIPNEDEAQLVCENDLKELIEKSKTATNIMQL